MAQSGSAPRSHRGGQGFESPQLHIQRSGSNPAIGTLVERQTGYARLLHLPNGYQPEQVRDARAAKIKTLPESPRLSLTWDQGPEMRDWKHVSIDAGIDIYFCDPALALAARHQ